MTKEEAQKEAKRLGSAMEELGAALRLASETLDVEALREIEDLVDRVPPTLEGILETLDPDGHLRGGEK